MTLVICPRCQRRFSVSRHTTDYVHECDSGNPVLDNEDVLVVGSWEDYTGSGGASIQVIREPVPNKLRGTRADIKGEKTTTLTRRGNKADIYRTRKHLEYIKLKND